ncbi:MAG: hypothetical protein KGK16_08510 [Bradyrhizobium sp.]|nr:hypothetical protein [Bradyrhizobium sp.]
MVESKSIENRRQERLPYWAEMRLAGIGSSEREAMAEWTVPSGRSGETRGRAGLPHIVPWIVGQTGVAFDARGYGWPVSDIREATVAILLMTMVFTALLAALRLLRRVSSS